MTQSVPPRRASELLTRPESVGVLDVKRENWSTSAGYRQRAGQSVYLFDPLDPEGRTARYNPLAHIRRADGTEVVNELQKIAVMLFPAPERSDRFWAEAARAAFIGVGALVAAKDRKTGVSGKRGSVGGDLGGRRLIQKKKT